MEKRCFWKKATAIILIFAVVSTIVLERNVGGLAVEAASGETEIALQSLAGNRVSIGVQIINALGSAVELAEPVKFYDGNGKLIKSGDILYSEEGAAVSVTSVDASTDANGKAWIDLKSSEAATIKNIRAVVSGYSVKYFADTNFENEQMQLSTQGINVRWIKAETSDIPRVSGMVVQVPKGERIIIKAQLMSTPSQKDGVPISDSGVPISFTMDGLSINTQEIVSEQGSRVNVLNADSYTENGIACLELYAGEEATIRRISTKLSGDYNNYSVKYIIGSDEVLVNRLDVSWTDISTSVVKPTPTPAAVPTKTPSAISTPTPVSTKTPAPAATRTPVLEPTPTPGQGKDNLSDLNDISCYVKNTMVSSGGKQKAAVKVTWTMKEEAYKYQIYRAEATGTEKLQGVCDASRSSFVDKSVKKGVRYYYKVRALGGTVQNSYTGDFSDEKGITIPSSLIKPVISHKKSKGNLTIYFKKAEGDKYQMQYALSGQKQWKKGPSGKLKSKDTKKFNAKGSVKIRVRTTMKVNGKQVYSKWSSTITVKA